MKASKIKQEEEMEIKDLKKLSIFVSIAFMIASLIFNGALLMDKEVYSNISPILIGLSIILGIVMLILSLNEKRIYMTYHIFGSIHGIVALLSIYLVCVKQLVPQSLITKILIFFNYLFINLWVFYKRIIVKDKDYITSVSEGTHIKYIKKDLLLSLIISAITITIAKVLDSSPIIIEKGELKLFIVSIIGIGVTICFSISYITAISNYLYNIKNNKSFQKSSK
ncbi:hypothetical protein [Clostridium sp. UBA3887]|uniref:hypothetical protein n=1 Tax=Clostridium sp. UBA3887 TaxID=1946356 RepID=UPI00321755CE